MSTSLLIDWSQAPDWATGAAMDADGSMWYYEHPPRIGETKWIDNLELGGRYQKVSSVKVNWKESYIKRPI